ncbi:MAG: type II toxin-antitoxin system VapC family toxin [Promethearchaeota archaeon]
MIVLDTSFLFAIKSKKDKNYKRANEILEDLLKEKDEVLITNELIFSETLTLAVYRFQGNKHHIAEYFKLFYGDENFFIIINFDKDDYINIFRILEKYCTPKRKLSFADASLIYIFKKYHADSIISFDNHFDGIMNRIY